MKVTVIGAGNSGIAMAAHLSYYGNEVTLWNRSQATVAKLMETRLIHCEGVINSDIEIYRVTDDICLAFEDTDIILITTPANSHKDLAALIAGNLKKSTVIVLNPGRTLGALEFQYTFESINKKYPQVVAETQTIIYTCRKTAEDAVNIIAYKDEVQISCVDIKMNQCIISCLPECIRSYFIPVDSLVTTSFGNVGMVLHCAPLLLNTGWTENKSSIYKYYYDGITPSVAAFIEKIDRERVAVSEALGCKVESTKEWLIRTYHVSGDTLYDCIQNNDAYKTIDAPTSMNHRYIFEDVPCGLVPLEAVGKKMGINTVCTSLVIDLASSLLNVDFRHIGRRLENFDIIKHNNGASAFIERRSSHD